MSEWVDFSVYAVFIAISWFVAARANRNWLLLLLADRNLEWLSANPRSAQRLTAPSRGYVWASYALGAVSLGVLTADQLGVWRFSQGEEHWMRLWVIAMASLLVGVVYYSIGAAVFAAQWKREVPVAERRHASLVRRTIDDFIPRRLRFLTYAVVAAQAGAWLAVGALRAQPTPEFWKQFGDMVILSATFSLVFSLIAHLNVNRPPNVLDRVLGPHYRREEIRMAFVPQLLPPAVGVVALYQQVNGSGLFEFTRGMHLGLFVLIILAFLRGMRQTSPRRLPPPCERMSPDPLP